ncbi:hypothetical protein KY290_029291 [Solanum tuberosum]|uniref:Uncharacterized protein n=1 Tax=Solanum tuberosum TaxID=4113 RepID=A0ABQ7UKB5_SOLTU|nr:hypothetical protein KY284_028294 [Solanum tuberosum]KAH0750059.1 hypothetical protein KY290_029291 [Solanum tuberosum]
MEAQPQIVLHMVSYAPPLTLTCDAPFLQGKNRKPWGSVNYHLQRLNRGRR